MPPASSNRIRLQQRALGFYILRWLAFGVIAGLVVGLLLRHL